LILIFVVCSSLIFGIDGSSSFISLYLNTSSQSQKYLSTFTAVSGLSLSIEVPIPNTFVGQVLSSNFDAVNLIYGSALNSNGSYSMGYISLVSLSHPTPSFNVVNMPSGYLLLGHEFRSWNGDSVVLLAPNDTYPATAYLYSISMSTFTMTLLFTISNFRYLSTVPLIISNNNLYLYSMTAPGSFGISGYSMITGGLTFQQTFETSFLCDTLGAMGNSLYCLSAQQVVSIDLTTGRSYVIAEFWCNSPGRYFKDSLAIDYLMNTAFSVWSSCNGVPTLYGIDLTFGFVTTWTNSNLANIDGIEVLL